MSTRNVEQEFDALKSDFSKLSADLVNLTEAIRDLAGKDAQAYMTKFRGAVSHANHDVEAAATALGERGRESAACIAHQIRERPLASILVCLGLGLVIGKLIHR